MVLFCWKAGSVSEGTLVECRVKRIRWRPSRPIEALTPSFVSTRSTRGSLPCLKAVRAQEEQKGWEGQMDF